MCCSYSDSNKAHLTHNSNPAHLSKTHHKSPSALSFSPFTTATRTQTLTHLWNFYWSTNCSQTHTRLPPHASNPKRSKRHRVQHTDTQHRSQGTYSTRCLQKKPPSSKSRLKLCSECCFAPPPSKLLFKLKGVDWVKAMTIESPHHSHKFASWKPHPVREREGERERERERGRERERERQSRKGNTEVFLK